MEDNSQKGDGSGDTGSKTDAGDGKDINLGDSKACLPQKTTLTPQTPNTPAPGASGDVGHASGLEIERDSNGGNVSPANVPTPVEGNTSENTASGHSDNSCHSGKGQEQVQPNSSLVDDTIDKSDLTNSDPTTCKSDPSDNQESSEEKAGVVEGTDNKQRQVESPGDEKESFAASKSGSEIPEASLLYTSTSSESLPHFSKQTVTKTQQRPAFNTEESSSECKNDSVAKDNIETLSAHIADSENSVTNAPETIQSKKSGVTDQNLVEESQSRVSHEHESLTSGKEKCQEEKFELINTNPACTEDTSLLPVCGDSTEKSQSEELLGTGTGDTESPCLDTSKTAERDEEGNAEADKDIIKDDEQVEEMEVGGDGEQPVDEPPGENEPPGEDEPPGNDEPPGDDEPPVEAEDASSDVASTGNNRKRHGSGSSVATFDDSDCHGAFPAANLFEYQWPQETGAEWYMLQEQISEFLAVKSFKRKYPDLQRRSVDMNEKVFLKDRGVVSETQCDLGLTALKSEEVLDLMIRDYPMRYREYAAVLHEKERQTISDKHKEYDVPKFEKSKLADYMKKAVKSAAEFNVQFQRERREDRRAYFDLQTMAIHYPQGKYKVAPPEATKVSPYPVALIPGQFQDYYKEYTPGELKYLPVGTAIYGPPKKFKDILANPSTGDTSDDTAEESGEDQGGSDSGSDDGDSSEAESMGVAPLPTPPPAEDVKPATPNGGAKADKQKPKREKKEEKEVEKTCRICKTGDDKVRGKVEDLVQCSECKTSGHPTCLELTTEMIAVIKTYPWQCMECKTCVECMDPYDEDKMMFCDRCDRGYHTFCVGVKSIPTGRWECPSCKDMPSKPKKSRRQTRQNGVPSPKPAVSN
ncbi:PHD finger protein 10-like isoform X2 [Liolophura sinensis]|uniref:PHD finger protein 10-like isoform X2 n=1 Tax=Liolophura sinensis TaxID=3198878 RepID=UPI0031585F56